MCDEVLYHLGTGSDNRQWTACHFQLTPVWQPCSLSPPMGFISLLWCSPISFSGNSRKWGGEQAEGGQVAREGKTSSHPLTRTGESADYMRKPFFLNLSPHSFNQETLAIRQLVIPTSVISPFIKGKGNLGSLGLDSCQNRGWRNNGGSWASISFPESFIRKQTLSAVRLNKLTERPIFYVFSLEW